MSLRLFFCFFFLFGARREASFFLPLSRASCLQSSSAGLSISPNRGGRHLFTPLTAAGLSRCSSCSPERTAFAPVAPSTCGRLKPPRRSFICLRTPLRGFIHKRRKKAASRGHTATSHHFCFSCRDDAFLNLVPL